MQIPHQDEACLTEKSIFRARLKSVLSGFSAKRCHWQLIISVAAQHQPLLHSPLYCSPHNGTREIYIPIISWSIFLHSWVLIPHFCAGLMKKEIIKTAGINGALVYCILYKNNFFIPCGTANQQLFLSDLIPECGWTATRKQQANQPEYTSKGQRKSVRPWIPEEKKHLTVNMLDFYPPDLSWCICNINKIQQHHQNTHTWPKLAKSYDDVEHPDPLRHLHL